VTAKGWSRFLNLKPLMYQYFRIETERQCSLFKNILVKLLAEVSMPFLVIEFCGWFQRHSVITMEELVKRFGQAGCKISFDSLKVRYDFWRELQNGKDNEKILSNVRHISLSSDQGRVEGIYTGFFESFQNIKSLDLSFIQVNTDFNLVIELNDGSLPNLSTLKMFKSRLPIYFRSLLGAAPHLTRLDLRWSEFVDYRGSSRLVAGSLPELTVMSLESQPIRNKDLQAVLRAAPRLRELDLASCSSLRSGLFDPFFRESLPCLESIVLHYTQVALSDLIKLLKAALNLKSLNLASCNAIKGQLSRFQKFDFLMEALEILDFKYSAIESRFVKRLLQVTPNLQVLNLTLCKKIRKGVFESFR
jgi:hypothetical protein